MRSTILALLAAAAVATGCGARSEQTADSPAEDAPGILVFSGLPSPPFLHSIRPDGSDLRGIALPKTCSPEVFTRDGRTLICWDLDADGLDGPFEYAVEREGVHWRRVSMPAEWAHPDWATPTEPEIDALEWSPSPGGDRIAFIRSTDDSAWFSSSGEVTVADADGSNERVLAEHGEAPEWSPDGESLVFARCRVFVPNWEEDEFAHRTAECSLWTVPVDGKSSPVLLAENAASAPVWSPDGRFIAFLRHSRACETYCRSRILIVPAEGGDPQEVGPELILQPEDCGPAPCPDLVFVWLPDAAPVIVPSGEEAGGDELELQRCVDIWNRARMDPFPTGPVNVSLVGDRCQVIVSDYGGVCTQSAEMPFRFWCPSHGAGLHMLPPEDRVWNAHGEQDGKVSLFEPPKGSPLQLPKAPPYPMLDGYVVPYGKDGEPLPDLKLVDVAGTCERGTGIGGGDRYPLKYPDGYALRCWWQDWGSDWCFKHPGRVEVGDIVLCPDAPWEKVYDPMRFFRVKVSKLL